MQTTYKESGPARGPAYPLCCPCCAPALAQWQEICIIMINTGERERRRGGEQEREEERERRIGRPAVRE